MRTIGLVAAATLFALPAFAQSSTTVIERKDAKSTGVVIEEHKAPPSTIIEQRTTETTGSVRDCQTSTVRKEGVLGNSTEVTKQKCD